MPMTYVLALNLQQAKAWCKENQVGPYAHTTCLISSEHSVRGCRITEDDRVIIYGFAQLRKDFPAIRASLTIAGATLENTEYVT